jgi:hypothetical protein
MEWLSVRALSANRFGGVEIKTKALIFCKAGGHEWSVSLTRGTVPATHWGEFLTILTVIAGFMMLFMQSISMIYNRSNELYVEGSPVKI